jgi:hypothetical protein
MFDPGSLFKDPKSSQRTALGGMNIPSKRMSRKIAYF